MEVLILGKTMDLDIADNGYQLELCLLRNNIYIGHFMVVD